MPIKILTNLLKNSGTNLRKSYLSVFPFSKTPYQRTDHIFNNLNLI